MEAVYKRFIGYFLVIVGILFCSNALLNYTLDAYGVFGSENLDSNINTKVAKINDMKRHHKEYDSYIIGNSRVGLIQPQQIEKYIPHSTFYNAWMSGFSIFDTEILMDYLLKQHYTVKNLYILIDFDYSIMEFEDSLSVKKVGKDWHYEVANTSALEFYTKYLLHWHYNRNLRRVNEFFNPTVLLDRQEGFWAYTLRKQQAQEDIDKYIRNEKSFYENSSYARPKGQEWVYVRDKIRTSINHIVANCRDNAINCIFVTTPHQFKILNSLEPYAEEMIEMLVNAIPSGLWHFSYYNSVTTDLRNYYEHSHHREMIDTLMLARVFNDKNISAPADFGIFITRDNLASSLEEIRGIESIYKPK